MRADGRRAAPRASSGESLHAMSTLMTGKRYLLLSVLATAIAVASTYQRLLTLTPSDWHELLLEHERNATASLDAAAAASDSADTATSTSSGLSATPATASAGIESLTPMLFVSELMRSRVSAAIVMHFYSVVMYHLFLVVAHACFGAIRAVEIQQTKETMIHFILMRCLLLASTMHSTQKTKMGLLLVWLSTVAFLRGILALCSVRFDHLLTRPMAQLRDLHRLALALVLIVALDVLVATVCSCVSVLSPLVVHFAWFEASLLLVKALQLGTKVAFHTLDVGNSTAVGAETSEFYLLVLQTALSAAYLVQLVVYYLYIIGVDQFRVSFLDFLLILNVKNATVQLLEHVRKVQLYHRVVLDLDALFPDATQCELDAVADDVCVICLKPMATQAKKLQCGHLFHRFCLRQCLQRASVGDAFATGDAAPATRGDLDTASRSHPARSTLRCPICRKHVHSSKADALGAIDHAPVAQAAGLPDADPTAGDAVVRTTDSDVDATAADAVRATEDAVATGAAIEPEMEEVMRFSTEFLSRWVPFPNFSFEIVRHRAASGAAPFAVTPEMVQHVWEVFPQYSVESIHADLLQTRSPERTIERILTGHFDATRTVRERGGSDVDDLALGLDDVDDDLRTSVSTLWSSLWSRQPEPLDRHGHRAEHIALHDTGEPRRAEDAVRERTESGAALQDHAQQR